VRTKFGATVWDGLDICNVDGGDRYPVAPPNMGR